MVLGFLGTAIKGLFGFKEAQANVISTAINAAASVGSDEGARAQAAATAIQAIYQNGGILEKSWRPCLMWAITVIVLGHFFGFMSIPATDPFAMRMLDFLEIGLIGYVPLRTFEKVINALALGSVLKLFIEKKLM